MSVEQSLESLGLSVGDPEELFEIHSREGAGAFGQVFRASYRSTRKEAALKVIQIALKPGQYGEDVDNVRREIEFLRECDHPNVVAFYGAYYKEGALWIAMEYCGGGSVGDISRQRRLCEQEISVIMRGALEGLAHLHSKKKIHRDVKEMIQDCNYDYKADIWSLGITAIELADQRPPLFDEHPMRVLIQIPRNPPPRLKQPQDWSANFSHFLQYCLTKSPTERPTATACLAHPFITCWRDIPRVVSGGVGGVLLRSKSNLHEGPERLLTPLHADHPPSSSSMPTIPESLGQSNASTLDDLIHVAQSASTTEDDDQLEVCDILGDDNHEGSRSDCCNVPEVVLDRLLAMVPPPDDVDDDDGYDDDEVNVLLEASSSAVSDVDAMDDLITLARASSMEPAMVDTLDDDKDGVEEESTTKPIDSSDGNVNNCSTHEMVTKMGLLPPSDDAMSHDSVVYDYSYGAQHPPEPQHIETPNDDRLSVLDQPGNALNEVVKESHVAILPEMTANDPPSTSVPPVEEDVAKAQDAVGAIQEHASDAAVLPPTSEQLQPEIEPVVHVEVKRFAVEHIVSGKPPSPPASPTHSAPTTFVGTPFQVAHDVCVRYNTFDAKYEGVPASLDSLHKHFGIPLSQMRCSTKHPDDLVPALLHMLRRELGDAGITAKYIYRSSPDHGQIQAAKLALNTGMFDGPSKRGDPYLLSSLIKCWFRELPTPLLAPCCSVDASVAALAALVTQPAGSTDVALVCNDLDTLDLAVRTFLAPLCDQARQIFEWLVEHWCQVVDKHTLNMMNAHSLAIVWVPNLISMPATSPQDASRVSNQVAAILQVCMLWWQLSHASSNPTDLGRLEKQPSARTVEAAAPAPPAPPSKPQRPLLVDGKLFHTRRCLVRVLQQDIDRAITDKWSFVDCQRQVLNGLRLYARTKQEREFADKLLQNPAAKSYTRPASLHDCGRWIDIAMDATAFAQFEAQQRDIALQLDHVRTTD
ncbi:hypothetical protein DYB34_008925 [Aphanomyces astaci]|uniref:Protein kinase domain-containing protein n=1 Tax=Aphanomyces astaci TaxID=112090 RepID=A0A3R6YR18_APHAT|nr:hypothetical protein DYB34_008925 [Aphanomyces astaci]